MMLYHGTNVDFQQIDIRKSNPYKDFGQGFYLTDIFAQAENMAAKKARIFGGNPIVQKYQFDEAYLSAPFLHVLLRHLCEFVVTGLQVVELFLLQLLDRIRHRGILIIDQFGVIVQNTGKSQADRRKEHQPDIRAVQPRP